MADEYIKRYDAGIAIAEILSPYGEDGSGDAISREVAMSKIRHIPPADVWPVVRARWEDETGYIFNQLAQRVYCPVCKSYAYFYPITMKNYCPSCGADMRPERGTKE